MMVYRFKRRFGRGERSMVGCWSQVKFDQRFQEKENRFEGAERIEYVLVEFTQW